MLEKKQNVFSSLSPKTTFFLGLAAAILVVCAIGFFILLASAVGDKDSREAQNTANTNGGSPSVQAQVPSPAQGGKVNLQISDSDHIRGNKNAPVKIVEFSDYQCSFCARHHPTMLQIMSEYGDQVAWVYKHFPLDSSHPEARPSAEASECIAEQAGDDGFWQFTDTLFANQQRLGNDYYEEVAQEIGVNLSQFKECVSSRKYQQRVEADYQEGIKAGVTGTPGNYVNGISVKGAVPFAAFKQIIDSELNK